MILISSSSGIGSSEASGTGEWWCQLQPSRAWNEKSTLPSGVLGILRALSEG
jgi:hypothetical protein